MADKQLTVLKDMKYGTRMLRAGEPVTMDGPTARLYTALGAVGPRDADGSGKLLPVTRPVVSAPAPKTAAKPKPARKRKAAAKKK